MLLNNKIAMPRKKTRSKRYNWSTRSRFSKPVDMPDVGAHVKELLYDLKISIPAVAKRMSVSADRAYRLMRRKDWKVSEIMNLSAITAENIFDWYAEQTQPSEQNTTTLPEGITNETEMLNLKQRNLVLEAENKLLREMMEMLKGKG